MIRRIDDEASGVPCCTCGVHEIDTAPHHPDVAALQDAATAAYGALPYQLGVHPQTFPDRLATVARLAGLDPPDLATARVLDIGAGTGFSTLAMAAIWPDAQFTAIDIDAAAVATGRRWAEAAGLTNARVARIDLLDPHGLADEYDYVIAHGVFAWVPRVVADALLALIGRVLAPNGVAFVSYNALPGSYLRLAVRDRALRAVAGATDPKERASRARAALADVDPNSASKLAAALGEVTKQVLDYGDDALIHDELGTVYEPCYLQDMVARARNHGLDYLGDASVGSVGDNFTGDEDPLEVAVDSDWKHVRGFRQTLLVRGGTIPSRNVDVDRLRDLYVASRATEPTPGVFQGKSMQVGIDDAALAGVLRDLIAAAPDRRRVGDLGLDGQRLLALVRMMDAGLVMLHAEPLPYTLEPGPAPIASALARVALAERLAFVPTLEGTALKLGEDSAAVVLACDGGDPARLADAARAAGLDTPEKVAEGLQGLARMGLFPNPRRRLATSDACAPWPGEPLPARGVPAS